MRQGLILVLVFGLVLGIVLLAMLGFSFTVRTPSGMTYTWGKEKLKKEVNVERLEKQAHSSNASAFIRRWSSLRTDR